MTSSTTNGQSVINYHEGTKHHLHRYARSAGYMDWDSQPAPFRSYKGAPSISLPLSTADPALDYAHLYHPAMAEPTPFTQVSLAKLMELSLGLSAWKAVPGQRWSLRINPSSGNLHPTEAHLLALGVDRVADGIYHYDPLDHALEERAILTASQSRDLNRLLTPSSVLVAFTSIFWRESWKYGERAYRYCQHDIGHALAAMGLAARLLGWRLVRLDAPDEDIAAAFGLDRTSWPPHEAENPALVAALCPVNAAPQRPTLPVEAVAILKSLTMAGHPSQLSKRHQPWEVIPRTAEACRQPRPATPARPPVFDGPGSHPGQAIKPAAAVIRQRRSAQAFDPEGTIAKDAFLALLDRTRPRQDCAPFDTGIGAIRVSLILFVHRVQDLAPGLYAFIRRSDHLASLRKATAATFAWEPAMPDFPLYRLETGDCRAEAMDLACRQEIAGFSTFSMAMLARFAPEVIDTPWVYRHLFWEAGMIGQVLYLEAEAQNLRGTGIGCYFDDPVHERLGLQDNAWQSLYHFTIGVPVEDARLQTLPPYFHLDPQRKSGR